MILSTTPTIEGHTIREYKGVVTSETIIGANLVKDIFAGIRDLVGGRSGSYEQVLREAKDTSMREMMERAKAMGANAIVGIDIDYETIENISGLTHGHLRSKIACVFYIEIAKSMLENNLTIDEHIKLAGNKIKEHYKDSGELHHFKRIFNDELNDEDSISSKGYVITTFESVIYSLKNTDNFRDAVLKAVNLGRDTDTVGAICGGLAGIFYGFDSIPIDWINEIPKIDEVIELCEKYEAYCNGCL